MKEARKMIRITISKKKQLWVKLNTMKEQAKEDWEAMNSIMNQLTQELSQEKE